ncbi:MAG TPA: arylsulfatase, partial [Longimicrobiales bacterium]|nr:arylsulfatase [Longimicrobiales bacterium]
SQPPATGSTDRPNIVIIMADDMGYSDIGAYGAEIGTPHLDRLAETGLRFRQFYNNAKCSPTRASLLTGLYPHQAGMGDLANGTPGQPGPYQGYLADNSVTMAEVLRTAGYRTYMSGKWHVGDLPEHWPHSRGFDRYFGLISGATSFFELLPEPGRSRQMVLEDRLWQPTGDGFYATDAYNDYAADRIREHRSGQPDRPFFLYVAHTAPHFPLHALPEDIARYADRYRAGWDRVREERYRRMGQLGIVGDRHVLSPRPSTVPAWEDAENKDEWARLMAVYAAMIDRMDQGIGRILRALDETGARDNTLILFLSDNGGTAEQVAGRGLNDPNVPIGARGSYVAYLEPWANVSNTPFRLYKNWVHEGGIITPLIANWPRGISRHGQLIDEAGHVIDLMPTVLELARVPYPALVEDRTLHPIEGRSLMPVFRGGTLDRQAPLYWAYGGNWAIREGDWKLAHDRRRPDRLELFNLREDPAEARDVAADYPARVAELQARWQAWAERVRAREAKR